MIFNSWKFILLFLPITFFVYFWLNRNHMIVVGKAWLVLTSLFFYAYWNIDDLALILVSILLNFSIGTGLAQSYDDIDSHKRGRRYINRQMVLTIGIFANLFFLCYYKYYGFIFSNINSIFNIDYKITPVHMPLAISFFTFTQIVYLFDSYNGETAEYDFLNYSLFVTFFPHLIAGPIVQHKQIMPQFSSKWNLFERYSNILKGMFIFSIGLFKKVIIADTFATWATAGFDGGQSLSFFAAWSTSLSYTFQIYYDFSGYCDMAVGASLLFNIWLPMNFNSPLKARNIQEFWKRWHITLGNFLRDHLYIPLGGNRHGELRTCMTLLGVFVLAGLWHGATWMYVVWGAMHGTGLVIHRIWRRLNVSMPYLLAWFFTFVFFDVSMVFFRSKTLSDAIRVLKGMTDIESISAQSMLTVPTSDLAWAGRLVDVLSYFIPVSLFGSLPNYLAIFVAFILISGKNSMQLTLEGVGKEKMIYSSVLMAFSMSWMLATTSTVFLYFNF